MAWVRKVSFGLSCALVAGCEPPPPTIDPAFRPIPDAAPRDATTDAPSAFTGPPLAEPASASAERPVSLVGGTLTVSRDQQRVYATDPERDAVVATDLARRVVLWTRQLAAGEEPGRIIEDTAGRVHVVLRRAGSILTLDAETGADIARRRVCQLPRGVAHDAAVNRLLVACSEGVLLSMPTVGDTAPMRIEIAPDLRDVVVATDGIYVSTLRGASLFWLPSALGAAAPVAIGPRMLRTGVTGTMAQFTRSVGWRLAPLRDGGVVFAHQYSTTAELPTTSMADSNSNYGNGGTENFGVIATAITVVKDRGATVRTVLRSDAPLPIDVTEDPERATVWFLSAANGISATVPSVRSIAAGDFGLVCPSGTCPRTAPSLAPTGEPIALGFSHARGTFAQTREPAGLWFADGTSVSFRLPSRADVGHRVFHGNYNASSNIACASCHPEGTEDGRVWNFVHDGPRRTQTLLGTVRNTAPYHWNGDLATFRAFLVEVWGRRMQGPALSDTQIDAVTRWIEGLRPLPARDASDATAVARGRALYESAETGCTNCHSGPQHSNHETVDVGTGRRFQVPALVGLGWRAPFMHNGCAQSMAERFDARCGGQTHGRTSALSSEQIQDLSAFLMTL